MTAHRLRTAAAKLREVAEAATPGPWTTSPSKYVSGAYVHQDRPNGRQVRHATTTTTADAALIATMSPPVALAMAAWLESEYVTWERAENSLGDISVRAMSGGTNEPSACALADVAAKRRIAEAGRSECAGHGAAREDHCDGCQSAASVNAEMDWVVRTLATAYSSHPDYDKAWRP